MACAYPRPSLPFNYESLNPRPLRSLESPNLPSSKLPSLPANTRQPVFWEKFTLTTHVIPAAYPRSSPDEPLPPLPPNNLDKATRKKWLSQVADDMLSRQQKLYNREMIQPSHKPLWNCINRYVRNNLDSSSIGLTLFFAHANGFPKEIWETTIDHLLSSPSQAHINEIWCWEAVQHGDSALINEATLSGFFEGLDNSRDIINFLLNFLPTVPTSGVLPVCLPRTSPSESEFRKVNGFKHRTFVVIGHSFGGNSSARAAVEYPALFSSLILVDPVLTQKTRLGNQQFLRDLIVGAINRRVHWPSREEAFRLMNENPFFRVWDPTVLQLYVECGLTDDLKNGGIKLKQSGLQEAVVFAGSGVAYEVWELLGALDKNISLKWIVPGEGQQNLWGADDSEMQIRVWRRPENCSNVRVAGAGHLIPQEKPKELAHEIDVFLRNHYGQRKASL